MATQEQEFGLSDPLWIHCPSVLFKETRLKEFWPSDSMSCYERVNAFSRFIIYLVIILYLVTEKKEYVVLGFVVLVIVGLVSKNMKYSRELFSNYPGVHEVSDKRFGTQGRCIMPTKENPFGNVPVSELNSRSLPACNYKDVSDETNKIMSGIVGTKDAINLESSSRQFYQMPVTESISNTERFGQFLFGQGPNCKSDPSVCTGFDYGSRSNVPYQAM